MTGGDRAPLKREKPPGLATVAADRARTTTMVILPQHKLKCNPTRAEPGDAGAARVPTGPTPTALAGASPEALGPCGVASFLQVRGARGEDFGGALAAPTWGVTDPWVSPEGLPPWGVPGGASGLLGVEDVAGWLPVNLPLSYPGARRAARGYLESVAKRSEGPVEGYNSLSGCGLWTALGTCEHGHTFAKILTCGREWCPRCGQNWTKEDPGSPDHHRRFARVWPKVSQLETAGYSVWTLPMEIRARFRTPAALNLLRFGIRCILERHGFARGVSRWHWFGDKSTAWNPHLNVLTDGRLIPREELEAIRAEYAVLLGVPVAVVNYHYSNKTGKIVHWLRYITRATFRNREWDTEMSKVLEGYRNGHWWGDGKWDGDPVHVLDGEENTPVVVALEQCVCPECGAPLHWQVRDARDIDPKEVEEIGAGYYKVRVRSRYGGGSGARIAWRGENYS
jgi:hypothetical protein